MAGVGAWRRGTAEERRILRWFGITVTVSLAATLVIGFLPELLFGRALVPWSVLLLFGLPIPFALAAAVLRDRAFDIELVVDRSLVYGGLTIAIVGIYAMACRSWAPSSRSTAGSPRRCSRLGSWPSSPCRSATSSSGP